MPNWRMISGLLVSVWLSACAAAAQPVTPYSPGATWIPFTQTAPPSEEAGNLTPAATARMTGAPKGQFSIFVGALEETGLAGRLRAGGSYTIFAPPDAMIDQMPEDIRVPLFQDRARLTEVLEYHIVEGKWTLDALRNASSLATLLGKPLTVTQGESQIPSVNGLPIHPSNLKVGNIVVYSIDSLLIPPG